MLHRYREILQYRIDDVFARGSVAQFALLLLLSLVIIGFGVVAYALFVFDPAAPAGGFLTPLWWSMGRVFAIDVDHEAATAVALATVVVALMGFVIFGILIGFISTSIEERLESLRKGDSKVMESGHMLVLGWSNKVAAVLRQLASFRKGMRVVVLAPREVEEMQEDLRVDGLYDLDMKIVLRTGQPGNLSELKRVAFDRAFGIIVLAADEAASRVDPDIEAIKTLMLISSFDGWAGARPKMVGEISRHQNLEVAKIAARHRVPIVSSSDIISKVIVQSSRQPGISKVYSEIFSVDRNEIYIQGFPQCSARRFGDLAYAFPHAVPIGVSRARMVDGIMRFIPELNPPPDYVVQSDEWIILVAEHASIECRIDAPVHTTDAPAPREYRQTVPERILILGWNHNIYVILRELDQYATRGSVVEVLSSYDDDEVAERLRTQDVGTFANIVLGHTRGNMTSRALLTRMNVSSYDCVIVLADESNPDGDPDAMTIMTLILLRDILAQAGAGGVRIVSELLEQRNREMIMTARVDDMVVSPLFVSMLLAQISQQQMLHSVYDELLSAGGVEIYLKPARRYVAPGTECSFAELIAIAQKASEVALGVQLAADGDSEAKNFGLEINPAKDARWTLGEEDKVIVLAPQLYD